MIDFNYYFLNFNLNNNLPYYNQLNYADDILNRFWNKVNVCYINDHQLDFISCWNWLAGSVKDGYGNFVINSTIRKLAHRFVFECFSGIILQTNQYICHHCDNVKCVNPYHLFLGSQIDNMNDKSIKNRQAKGSIIKSSKFTEKSLSIFLNDILDSKYDDWTISELASHFNVGNNTIRYILMGRTWKHITCNYDLNLIQSHLKIGISYGSSKSIFDENNIIQLLNDINDGKYINFGYNKISQITQIPKSIILDILNGNTWKHISKHYNLKELKQKCQKITGSHTILTDDQVLQLLININSGKYKDLSAKQICDQNPGLSEQGLFKILNGYTWKHLTCNFDLNILKYNIK